MGMDGKRYVFPNEATYRSWYSDFSTVQTITDKEPAQITIGGNVTYRLNTPRKNHNRSKSLRHC